MTNTPSEIEVTSNSVTGTSSLSSTDQYYGYSANSYSYNAVSLTFQLSNSNINTSIASGFTLASSCPPTYTGSLFSNFIYGILTEGGAGNFSIIYNGTTYSSGSYDATDVFTITLTSSGVYFYLSSSLLSAPSGYSYPLPLTTTSLLSALFGIVNPGDSVSNIYIYPLVNGSTGPAGPTGAPGENGKDGGGVTGATGATGANGANGQSYTTPSTVVFSTSSSGNFTVYVYAASGTTYYITNTSNSSGNIVIDLTNLTDGYTYNFILSLSYFLVKITSTASINGASYVSGTTLDVFIDNNNNGLATFTVTYVSPVANPQNQWFVSSPNNVTFKS